jgi:enterochelin esterase-like enzyme
MRATALTALFVPLLAGLSAGADPTAEELIARHEREKAPAWADGDTATFFHRGEADRVTLLIGGQTKALRRLPGTDVWTLAVELLGLERGVFTYAILPRRDGEPDSTPGAKLPLRTFRGPKAPPAAPAVKDLAGKVSGHRFDSAALGGTRGVAVYLPPGHDKAESYPAVFATDARLYADVLDALVTTGKVRPLIVVGAEAGPYLGDRAKYDPKQDLRAAEYLPGIDADRFDKHERFVTGELVPWAVKEFGASREAGERAVFGCSNGARFAVEMGLRHPDVFGHVFAFSVADGAPKEVPERASAARFRLASGTWETGFHRTTEATANVLREKDVRVEVVSRVSGHDEAMWRDEWAASLVAAFGTR